MKKPSERATIKLLQQQNTALVTDLTEMRKRLASVESQRDSHSKALTEANSELEQLHSVLDAIPAAPVREVTDTDHSWIKHKRNTVARLCALFATRPL